MTCQIALAIHFIKLRLADVGLSASFLVHNSSESRVFQIPLWIELSGISVLIVLFNLPILINYSLLD